MYSIHHIGDIPFVFLAGFREPVRSYALTAVGSTKLVGV